jgi:hypothetical protein
MERCEAKKLSWFKERLIVTCQKRPLPFIDEVELMFVFGPGHLLCAAALSFIGLTSAPVVAQQDGSSNGRILPTITAAAAMT